MATIVVGGVEHKYAPNPTFVGEDWSREYPPIESDAPFLRNKFTGELVPNLPDFAKRSDILEPYYDETTVTSDVVATLNSVSSVLDIPELDEL